MPFLFLRWKRRRNEWKIAGEIDCCDWKVVKERERECNGLLGEWKRKKKARSQGKIPLQDHHLQKRKYRRLVR
jgi:hypothetical protein